MRAIQNKVVTKDYWTLKNKHRIDKVKGMVNIELYIEVRSIKNSISSILMTCTSLKTTNRVGKSVSQGSAHVLKFRLSQEQVVIFHSVGKDSFQGNLVLPFGLIFK